MITTIFQAIVKSDRRGRGAAGETFAEDLFKKAGYEVRRRKEKTRSGDLQVIDKGTGEFWNVEVKTAKQRPDGKYCFQLICNSSTAHTDYRYSDYVVLLAILPGGKVASYLISSKILESHGAKSITISNVNAGKWTDYRIKRTVRL